MRVAVVAEISFFDNVILQKVVEVEDGATWKDAYVKYLSQKEDYDEGYADWVETLPNDLADARHELNNGEIDICVTFI